MTNYSDLIEFPHVAETEAELTQARKKSLLSSLTKVQALETPGNTSEFRVRCVELPQSLFQIDNTGAVILHPSHVNSTIVNITTCTLAAGWGTSIAKLGSKIGNIFSSEMYDTPPSWPTSSHEFVQDISFSLPNLANISGFVYPQRRIALTEDWLRFLNPTIRVTDIYNTTAMHLILTSGPGFTDDIGIPQVLALILACGLATYGIELGWQGIFHPFVGNGTCEYELTDFIKCPPRTSLPVTTVCLSRWITVSTVTATSFKVRPSNWQSS